MRRRRLLVSSFLALLLAEAGALDLPNALLMGARLIPDIAGIVVAGWAASTSHGRYPIPEPVVASIVASVSWMVGNAVAIWGNTAASQRPGVGLKARSVQRWFLGGSLAALAVYGLLSGVSELGVDYDGVYGRGFLFTFAIPVAANFAVSFVPYPD